MCSNAWGTPNPKKDSAIKKKICILQTHLPSNEFKSGGEERFTLGLVNNLKKSHEVHILTRESDSFFWHILKLIGRGMKLDADIYQAHISDTSNGIAGVFLSWIKRKPLIIRVSGFGPVSDLSFIRRQILRFIFKHSDLVVSINNNFMVDDIRKLWEKSKIVVMPHGIDIKESKPKRFPSRTMEMLFVGRLIYSKNVDDMLRAMRIVPDVRLTIIGTGPMECHLRKLADYLCIQDRVTFKGEMPHDDVMRYMRKSDIFVFPSWREPRGLVLIEAMLAGLPIIAVNRGGPMDILKHGINGYLVEPRDYEMMEHAIRSLSDKNDYERISRNNIADVKRYSWDDVAKEWEAMYEKAYLT